jgi:Domain of unknown function (DUF4340)
MNSRTLLNLLLFVFIVCASFIFISRNDESKNTLKLSSLNIDEIEKIHIDRDSDRDILFVKKSNNIWYMTKPFQIKAHPFRIKTLLGLTQTPVNKSYAIDSLNLSDYALDPPRARITFNSTEFAFGKTNSINNQRYLLAENKLTLINDQVYPLVSAQASSFIDLSILPDNYTINKIRTPEITILLNNNGAWESTGNNRLNADQIQQLLQNWSSAQAFAIHKYMIRKQLGKIEISSLTKTLIFEITDTDPWLILALPDVGLEYHLDKTQKDLLYGAVTPHVTPDAPDA